MKYVWFAVGAVSALAVTGAVAYIAIRARRRAALQQADRLRLARITEGICAHAPVFEGLYEGLYQSVQNQQAFFSDAYEEWCHRAAHLDDEAFRQAFGHTFSGEDRADEALCRHKCAQLLDCIGQAGIRRLHESGEIYTADEDMQRAYYLVSGAPGARDPAPGRAYTVLASAWAMDDKIVEHGTVVPASAEEGGDDHV